MAISREKLIELYKALPHDVAEVYEGANTGEVLLEIGRKHALSIDLLGRLSYETGLVLIGASPARDLVAKIGSALGVSNEKAREIAMDINHELFQPIRESLKQIHRVSPSEALIPDESKISREEPKPLEKKEAPPIPVPVATPPIPASPVAQAIPAHEPPVIKASVIEPAKEESFWKNLKTDTPLPPLPIKNDLPPVVATPSPEPPRTTYAPSADTVKIEINSPKPKITPAPAPTATEYPQKPTPAQVKLQELATQEKLEKEVGAIVGINVSAVHPEKPKESDMPTSSPIENAQNATIPDTVEEKSDSIPPTVVIPQKSDTAPVLTTAEKTTIPEKPKEAIDPPKPPRQAVNTYGADPYREPVE